MYIFDIENKSSLRDVLLENLKVLGVRCRLPKKLKENEKENIYSSSQVFQKPLHLLKKSCVYRLDGSLLEIPEFIVDACSVIEKDIKVEGIFRKAGSTCKQKERKLELNQGKKVSCDYHVFDACSLVKLFFRELPQPILPYAYHEIFLKCLLLSTYEKELDALMLACLLLPEENLSTLAFFMEFLLKVSWHADKNKMNAKNLAIILTPTLMPLSKETRTSNSLEMSHHFKVVEMLIENAQRIGRIPDEIVARLLSLDNKKSKKKRRSGSITRMFTGLKKMVGSKGPAVSDWNDSIISTPDSLSSIRKRKNGDSSSTINLSAKKKRLTDSVLLGNLTPLRCRMHGYSASLHTVPSPIPSNLKRNRSQSPSDKKQDKCISDDSSKERGRSRNSRSRLNLVRRCTTRKQKSQSKLGSVTSLGSLFNIETEKTTSETKNLINWGTKKKSLSSLFINKSDSDYHEESSEDLIDLSDSEFVTVPKSEYEDIKNRVSALEEDLEILTAAHSVQSIYEKTLEESERLNEPSTEQLATRLSRELKIRSSDSKVIRSPSARKIGSIRRRSREMVQRNSELRSNLKRGRPNTVQTGLPSPRLRATSSENDSPLKKNSVVTRSSTFRGQKGEWKSGEIFFAKDHLLQKLTPTPQGRPSIAEIRCQNAGMVLEKAKLFNSLNESKEKELKVQRRQSVRLENLRRLNETERSGKKKLTRTKSLGSDKKPTKHSFVAVEKGVQSKGNRDVLVVAAAAAEGCTPKPHRLHVQQAHTSRKETPSIKKSLVTRSPGNFTRTPLSQMRSNNRSRATPMKALIENGGTPHIGLRRSPRILARAINTPVRLRD